jgi:hypothetical protein
MSTCPTEIHEKAVHESKAVEDALNFHLRLLRPDCDNDELANTVTTLFQVNCLANFYFLYQGKQCHALNMNPSCKYL